MRTTLRSLAGVVALTLVLVLSGTFSEPGGGATVFNHKDGATCYFYAEGGSYDGAATIVGTPSGNVNIQCNAKISWGTPVSKGTRLVMDFSTPYGIMPCDVQLTPSGNGNVSCHQ